MPIHPSPVQLTQSDRQYTTSLRLHTVSTCNVALFLMPEELDDTSQLAQSRKTGCGPGCSAFWAQINYALIRTVSGTRLTEVQNEKEKIALSPQILFALADSIRDTSCSTPGVSGEGTVLFDLTVTDLRPFFFFFFRKSSHDS